MYYNKHNIVYLLLCHSKDNGQSSEELLWCIYKLCVPVEAVTHLKYHLGFPIVVCCDQGTRWRATNTTQPTLHWLETERDLRLHSKEDMIAMTVWSYQFNRLFHGDNITAPGMVPSYHMELWYILVKADWIANIVPLSAWYFFRPSTSLWFKNIVNKVVCWWPSLLDTSWTMPET